MKKKLLLSYFLAIAISCTMLATLISVIVGNIVREQVRNHQLIEAKIIASAFFHLEHDRQAFASFVAQIETESRITIIKGDGSVAFDTAEHPNNLVNHANRDEFIEARKTGRPIQTTRFSSTLKTDFIYTAVPVAISGNSWVVRTAKPVTAVSRITTAIALSAVGVSVLTAVVALLYANFRANRMLHPIRILQTSAGEIAQGSYGKQVHIRSGDEVEHLADSFNEMSEKLSQTIADLSKKNSELHAIMNSVDVGIVALELPGDREGIQNSLPIRAEDAEITLVNASAVQLMGAKREPHSPNLPLSLQLHRGEIGRLIESVLSSSSQKTNPQKVHAETEIEMKRYSVIPMEDRCGVVVAIHDLEPIRRLEKMRSNFVSNVTHELKTPLTSIKGFVETLRSGHVTDAETAQRFLSILDSETDRLIRLIDDILLLSSLESMAKERHKEEVNLSQLARESAGIVQPMAEAKGLRLALDVPEHLSCCCNPDRIKQVMINLLDNAVKYTEKGEIRLRIVQDTSPNPAGGDMQKDAERKGDIRIQVSDTGIGFDPENAEHIFERFYRVDRGRSRSMGGTGLGLSIVKHIVQMHSGNISATSEPGKGSTFAITLPSTASPQLRPYPHLTQG